MNKKFIILLPILLSLIFSCSAKKEYSKTNPRKLKPGSAKYLLNEGIYYLNNGDIDLAEKKLTQALTKEPSLLGAINGLGIVYLNKREFDKAVKQFRRVIQMNPKIVDAYNYLGVIFTETGKYELAKENLLIAANSEYYKTPENAYANLALLEVNHNKTNSALRYIEKGLAHNKNFPPLYNIKGIIHENMKEYKRAIYYYEKALSLLTEDDVSYLVNIGRTYSKMGEKNKALDILEKALPKAYNQKFRDQIRKMIQELEK
jgi:Tfp pilus assembly protein PilF